MLFGARFAKRPLRDLGRRSAPVVDRNPSFLLETFVQQLKNVGLHGAIKHQPTFLLGGFNQLGVLGEGGGDNAPQNEQRYDSHGYSSLLGKLLKNSGYRLLKRFQMQIRMLVIVSVPT